MSHLHAHDHGRGSGHGPGPDAETDPSVMFTQAWWDARYRSAPGIWSGNPNPQLVAQVADLTPGAAQDVGCGEGADAIWLAERGWQVTAIDVSPVALERGAQIAAGVGAAVAERITWQQVDVLNWQPAPRQFHLVSAQFMHPPAPAREVLYRQLAEAVRPGGTLLVVGHHPRDLATSMRRPNLPNLLFTAEEIAALLDPADWRIVVAEAIPRQALDPAGASITIHDAVLRAQRRP